ncbi:MAG: FAD-binding oxidoreductase [Actinomycetota bacterium]|nr:FAD-binding oxidoreductase [Actinomycetota bacterium]
MASNGADSGQVIAALRRAGVAEVDDSALSRSLYASDASLYRVSPTAVVIPRDIDDLTATLDVCRDLCLPLTMRGAGTSIAGNAVGAGVVADVSRHLNRILDLDPVAGTAVVQPGVVQASLQRAAVVHGWRFGPDPSTYNRATIGGMIGNNACGARTLSYGRTSDNILGLDVLTGSGQRLRLGSLADNVAGPASGTGGDSRIDTDLMDALRRLTGAHLGTIRTEFGTFGRQISGYALEHLLPERGFDVSKALVGSEGTLAVTLAAEVRLVRDPPIRRLVVLGYPSMAEAADAVPGLLPHGPTACEGLDRRIVDVVRARRGASAVPPLPRGSGWLLVELAGEVEEVEAGLPGLIADGSALDTIVVRDELAAAAVWRIREDGAGLSARTPAGEPAHAGWEDAAVPPAQLGAYLREFEALMASHGVTGLPYGHFGDGCLHIRIDFPFARSGRTSPYRDFVYDAARLAASHGGSMSGEHGDGRARSELLSMMYSPEALSLFEQVKELFDPDRLLNPGVIVSPVPLDAGIRVAAAPPVGRRELRSLALAYRHDRGDLSIAVHRCTGVGKCLADTTSTGGVMCPSYLATREEKDSTRGRARVLQDVVAGQLGDDGFASDALADALDLCLSCKGCASDCPTGVDMASYKAEALHQRYRRRLRPRAHYALGWLPRWAGLAHRARSVTGLANRLLRSRSLHPFLTWAAGVDRRRPLPTLSAKTFLENWPRRSGSPPGPAPNGSVVLFVDSFTEHFSPEIGTAMVSVLETAGYAVTVPETSTCCGLTWISTGQLDGARRQLRRTVRVLAKYVHAGALVVGVEPSCTAVLRSDAEELLRGNDAILAGDVAAATRTLAELLTQTPDWAPPDLRGTRLVAQPHCHHHAIMGWSADADLLRRAGAEVLRLGGCCGLAGNFGVERGHHDVSVAIAEHQLLPAVRDMGPNDRILADGFSCRTQLSDLAGARSEHLAELLGRP